MKKLADVYAEMSTEELIEALFKALPGQRALRNEIAMRLNNADEVLEELEGMLWDNSRATSH